LGELRYLLLSFENFSNSFVFQVNCSHNSKGYFTIYGDETDYNDHFSARLVSGISTTETWARTGYLGFLRKTECSQACSLLEETLPVLPKDEQDYDQTYPPTLASKSSANNSTGKLINRFIF
jgi:hypothetical protein